MSEIDPFVARDGDNDNDDIAPGVGRIIAHTGEGKFYARQGDDRVELGAELRVVLLANTCTRKAYPPNADPDFPHPFRAQMAAMGLPESKPFCYNADVKAGNEARQPYDLTEPAREGLRALGWTGNCGTCKFRKRDAATGLSACVDHRELLVLPEQDDCPSLLSLKGGSIGSFKGIVKRHFMRGQQYLHTYVRPLVLSFQSRVSTKGRPYHVVQGTAEELFDRETVLDFARMRELYRRDLEEGVEAADDGVHPAAAGDQVATPVPQTDDEALAAVAAAFG